MAPKLERHRQTTGRNGCRHFLKVSRVIIAVIAVITTAATGKGTRFAAATDIVGIYDVDVQVSQMTTSAQPGGGVVQIAVVCPQSQCDKAGICDGWLSS